MKTVATIAEVRSEVAQARADGRVAGLVPTMGALHAGHLELVRVARQQCGFVAVSIFVNPTQFGAGEDLETYPRTLPDDLARCETAGVDLVFAPSAETMYPQPCRTWIEVEGVSWGWEGGSRPGHFRGVATVCAKLFNIFQPDRAFFGRKDYQQLQVLRAMARDLDFGMEIVGVDTVREQDGLAMSSRNAYLTPDERASAPALFRALQRARQAFDTGERDAAAIERIVKDILSAEPLADIDYAAVADADTLEPLQTIEDRAVVLVAVRYPGARLIDNIALG